MNVHQGGGLSLLLPLIQTIAPESEAVLLVDARACLPETLPARLIVRRVVPTLSARWAAERWLAREVQAEDMLLCFGNLPPLFRSQGRVVVFVQNRYLIDPVSLSALPWRQRLRLAIERIWLGRCARHAQAFVVQTPTMQRLTEAALPGLAGKTHIWPYAAAHTPLPRAGSATADAAYSFIYPASGDAHKNHRRLVEAWVLLAVDGCRPELQLTFDSAIHPGLTAFVAAQTREHGLAITCLGLLPHAELLARYSQVDALIYPSLLESFGLPLIEAASAGLPVVAAELDYVRDILDPVQGFDPLSPVSIARAVKRQLGRAERELGLLSAAGFLAKLRSLDEVAGTSETATG
jgi:glycosyltransferase involved in cell wall biosynthesis